MGKKIGTLKAGGGKKIGPLARIYTPVIERIATIIVWIVPFRKKDEQPNNAIDKPRCSFVRNENEKTDHINSIPYHRPLSSGGNPINKFSFIKD